MEQKFTSKGTSINSSKEALIKALPSPDLRCEAANSYANPCDP